MNTQLFNPPVCATLLPGCVFHHLRAGASSPMQAGICTVWSHPKLIQQVLGIVTRGDQQVSQDQQLVICELLLMLLPVVVVSPSEV